MYPPVQVRNEQPPRSESGSLPERPPGQAGGLPEKRKTPEPARADSDVIDVVDITGAPGSVLAQDIQDACLKTLRTGRCQEIEDG